MSAIPEKCKLTSDETDILSSLCISQKHKKTNEIIDHMAGAFWNVKETEAEPRVKDSLWSLFDKEMASPQTAQATKWKPTRKGCICLSYHMELISSSELERWK